MAAKATKAKAAATTAAPAVDQAGGAPASSAGAQEAGTAPATGAASETTQGAGAADGAAAGGGEADPAAGTAGEGDNSQGAGAGESDPASGPAAGAISGDSGNALTHEGAKAPTTESANAQPGPGSADELDDGDESDDAGELETVQTPAESEPDGPVILGAWSLPAINQYPATLTLTNHTPSRLVVMGKGIPVDGSIELEVTEQQFSKLVKSVRGQAQLDKWDNVRGLQVAYDPQN